MAHKSLSTSGSQTIWSLSTPTSPLAREASSQVVGGYLTDGGGGGGSRLVPYNPGGGSLLPSSSPSTARPLACLKIRNGISAEEKQEICIAFELFDTRRVGKHNLRDLKSIDRGAISWKKSKVHCQKLSGNKSIDLVRTALTTNHGKLMELWSLLSTTLVMDRLSQGLVAMRALHFPVKKAECWKLIQEYCKDGSDEIDQDEFTEIITAKYQEKDPDEDLAQAFRYFDEYNTGKISLKNLRRIARELGEHITDAELATMIDECDAPKSIIIIVVES